MSDYIIKIVPKDPFCSFPNMRLRRQKASSNQKYRVIPFNQNNLICRNL